MKDNTEHQYTYEPLILTRSSQDAPLKVSGSKRFGKAKSIKIVVDKFAEVLKKRNRMFVPIERKVEKSRVPNGIVMRTNKPMKIAPDGTATFIGIRKWRAK